MKKTYYILALVILFLGIQGCKKESVDPLIEEGSSNLSLKASFDQQYSKSDFQSEERSFNENFRTEILWNNVTFRTADTAIVKVKLLDDVKIYTNDSIPVNLAENLIVKAAKNSKGEWIFVKVIYLPEYGKDLPSGFTGRIISEGYFDNNYMVAKYMGGNGYFATFNSDNTWFARKANSKLKAEVPLGDPRCQPEDDGGTVIGYVEGVPNTVWHRPKSPAPAVCNDDPQPTGGGGGGSGGNGTPADRTKLSPEKRAEFTSLELKYRKLMSPTEIAIYDKMNELDKFVYLKNADAAKTKAEALFPANSLYLGKGDAFRHAYFSAMNAIDLGNAQAKLLGDAHEAVPQQALDKQMDLFNNQVGRDYDPRTYKNGNIDNYITEMMNTGKLRYLTPLGANGDIIPGITKLTPTNK
ncbi:DUF6973 domain-containing protein [Sphingobacterium anhuiense]|uniref:DUF6973 domain-containing protein n=1 Tax=Sphingobacterium anhuiense TaxID=493780 RepID=UPI003C2EE7E1